MSNASCLLSHHRILAYLIGVCGGRSVICPSCHTEAPDDLGDATPIYSRDELTGREYCEVCERDL